MSFDRIIGAVVVLALSMLAAAPAAWAQDLDAASNRRPFRGLFGAGDAAANDRSSMTLLLSTFGGYDYNLQGAGLQGFEVSNRSGVDPGMQAALTYRRPGRRFQLAWAADAYARRFAVADGLIAARGETMVALSARLTRQASVQLAQRVGYSPQLLFSALPRFQQMLEGIDETAAVPVNRLITEPFANADSMAGLTYAFGDASTFTLDYGYHRAESLNGQSFDVVGNRIGGRFTQRIARNISARAGYGLHVAEYNTNGTRQEVRTHDIDIGVDYRRSLSLTRRTRLNVSTGTTVVAANRESAVDAIGHRLEVRAIGTAEVVREFGRTWTTQLGYDRGVQFSDRIAAPALTDTVAASARGLLGRRVGAEVSAAFTIAQVGLGAEADTYESLTGLAQLQYALTRRWALFADYAVYEYRFATMAQLPSSLPNKVHHSSARAGLTWRVPLLR